MENRPTPIFLLSLPRSGSTLLQRVLAAHSAIATRSEPWLLLPLAYGLRTEGILTEYGQWLSHKALEQFVDSLRGGREAYRELLREFVLGLYEECCGQGERYFLDKTPRYHLILDELRWLFPDAKYVFLWRNPLAVAASIANTWHSGRWVADLYEIDLHRGLAQLARAREELGERAHDLQFEQFLAQPEASLKELLVYLELPDDPDLTRKFTTVELTGKMGDKTGSRLFSEISGIPRDSWIDSYGTRARRAWARRYLNMVGDDLRRTGYDPAALRRALDEHSGSARFSLKDSAQIAGARWSSSARRRVAASPKLARLFDWNPNRIR